MIMFLCELLATFIESYMGYYFLEGVLGERPKKYRRYAALAAVMTAAVILANSIKLYSGWTTIFAFVFLVVTAFLFEKIRLIDGITITAFYFILMHLVDFLVMSVQGTILKNPLLAQALVRDYSYERCVFLAVSKSGLVLISLTIRNLVYRLKLPFRPNIVFTIVGTGIIILLGRQTFQSADRNMMTIWIMFLAFIFSTFFLTNIYIAYLNNMEQQKISEMKGEALADRIMQLMQMDYEQKKLAHDINGHIMVLTELMEKGRHEEALHYIHALAEPIRVGEQVSWTGNAIVDFILNRYKKKAAEEGIRLKIDADRVDFIHKNANDLCAMFCNLLDNAFEAVRKNSADKRKIEISIRQFEEVILIQIENFMSVGPLCRGGRLVTSKEDEGLHGIGLKSVEDIVGGYGGLFSYHYDSERFQVEIAFFNSNEKEAGESFADK